MSQLSDDIEKLADDVVTKKDIIAAFKIMGEVTGGLALFSMAVTAFTVWIPGLGIPISGALAARCLAMMAKEYANLPTDQRRVIAKCAKYLHGIID